MTIVAHTHPFVVRVDTHSRSHAFAILAAATGELIASEQFPASAAGLSRAVSWVARRTGGDLAALWVIEGVATYGARLTRVAAETGYEVVEAGRMDARAHPGTGKSDPLDARRIAASLLSLDRTELRYPRADNGVRAALRVLVTAREHMTTERTAAVYALTALLRISKLGIDARTALIGKQITAVEGWRTRPDEVATATARAEVVRLASGPPSSTPTSPATRPTCAR